eukprot:9007263-Lingulodinium_polyedra.AAC.1
MAQVLGFAVNCHGAPERCSMLNAGTDLLLRLGAQGDEDRLVDIQSESRDAFKLRECPLQNRQLREHVRMHHRCVIGIATQNALRHTSGDAAEEDVDGDSEQ